MIPSYIDVDADIVYDLASKRIYEILRARCKWNRNRIKILQKRFRFLTFGLLKLSKKTVFEMMQGGPKVSIYAWKSLDELKDLQGLAKMKLDEYYPEERKLITLSTYHYYLINKEY